MSLHQQVASLQQQLDSLTEQLSTLVHQIDQEPVKAKQAHRLKSEVGINRYRAIHGKPSRSGKAL
ncbi:hypothetical protein [Spirosoma fluminis]